jgi:hypothetical protein
MAENKQGSRKAPRTHQKHWADTTNAARTQDRNAALNEIAGKFGWFNSKTRLPSWSAYETAVINGETQPTLRESDTRHAPDGGGASDNHGGL